MFKILILAATLTSVLMPASVGAGAAPPQQFEGTRSRPASNDECWLRAGCRYLEEGIWICPSPDTYQECKVPDHVV